MTPSKIQDHFLSLLSIERPLFLPKKVSLEAVIPCMPSELLFWKRTAIIASTDAIKIRTRQVIKTTQYNVDTQGAIPSNKTLNILKPL